MVAADTIDYFFVRNLTELAPPRDWQPGRKVRNWRDHLYGIAGATCEMLYTLMNKNSLKGTDLVGIKSCERQNSQAQSIETRFPTR